MTCHHVSKTQSNVVSSAATVFAILFIAAAFIGILITACAVISHSNHERDAITKTKLFS